MTSNNESQEKWQSKLMSRVKDDPLVFIFLGATVAALTVGLRALLRADRRQSQLMMRARVGFQLCTVGALIGGVYWRAYRSGGTDFAAVKGSDAPRTDKRVYLTDPRAFEVTQTLAPTVAPKVTTVSDDQKLQ